MLSIFGIEQNMTEINFALIKYNNLLSYPLYQSEERDKERTADVPLRPAGSTPCVAQPIDAHGAVAAAYEEEHGIYLAYYRFRRWVCVVDTAVVAKRDLGKRSVLFAAA